MLSDPFFSQLYAFVSVVIIDLVLAGDNAIVVGMAASGLPREKRQRVIMIGIVLALLFRVLFALIAVQLLAIIGLLLARHHWLSYLGLAIITFVALTMIWEGAAEVWTVVASG